MPQCHRLEV